MQLPDDPAQHLAVVATGSATQAVGSQERSYAGECLVGELEHPPPPGWCGSWSATLSASTIINSQVRLQY
jgi:hypothetical protein